MEQLWSDTPAPARSKPWKKRHITLFWSGPSGWSFERKNSRRTWPHIDRKRTREQLRLLVRVSNHLRRSEIDDR